MDNLVPIKVRIGLGDDNRHVFPQFNALARGVRGNSDWSKYVDRFGGWLYDRVAGHRDEDPESPRGWWIGLLLVPEQFATEAADRWPKDVEVMDSAEAGNFYESRVTFDQPDILDDLDALQLIAAKRGAGLPEDESDIAALDPDNRTRGRRRNTQKTWQGYLSAKNISVGVAEVARAKAKHAEAMARARRG